MNRLKFANIYFSGLTKESILEESDALKIIVTANAEFIVKAKKNEKFLQILNENYTTFDGQVPYLIAKIKNPGVKFEKLSGSDLIYDFCELAQKKNKKIFLLGGKEESNRLAVEKLKERYNIEIEGYSPPYRPYPFDPAHNQIIINKIKNFKPDILFVAFGAVKQEFWIVEHQEILNSIGVKWAIGCGGAFDFVAGTIKRAPKFIQNIGLEWFYRLIREPKRLFRRYAIVVPLFIYYITLDLIKDLILKLKEKSRWKKRNEYL